MRAAASRMGPRMYIDIVTRSSANMPRNADSECGVVGSSVVYKTVKGEGLCVKMEEGLDGAPDCCSGKVTSGGYAERFRCCSVLAPFI